MWAILVEMIFVWKRILRRLTVAKIGVFCPVAVTVVENAYVAQNCLDIFLVNSRVLFEQGDGKNKTDLTPNLLSEFSFSNWHAILAENKIGAIFVRENQKNESITHIKILVVTSFV
jgi:hypothetical protein